MKNITSIFWIAIFASCFMTYAQEYQVELLSSQNEKGFVLSAKNNSSIQQEVTLTLETKNLRGYKEPIKKLVEAGKTLEMITLYFIPGKASDFSTSYQFNPKPTDSEIAAQDEKLKAKTLENVEDIENGITLFYQDGCPRCAFATTYMLDNDIDFKLIDVTDQNENNAAMWELLIKKNPELDEVIFPVFIINGDISYNIEDLGNFTDTLFEFKL